MFIISVPMVLALAALLSAVSTIIWSLRRKP